MKKFLLNSISNYFVKIFNVILYMIYIPILINSLGESQLGIILFLGSILGSFLIFDLGLSQGIIKFTAEYFYKKDSKSLNYVINTSFFIFLFLSLFLSFVILFSYPIIVKFFDINISFILILFLSILVIFSWTKQAIDSVLKGLNEFFTLNLLTIFGRLLSVSLSIYAALKSYPLYIVFLSLHLDKIILFFIEFLIVKKLYIPFFSLGFKYFNLKTLKVILPFSLWILLSQIAVVLEYEIDQYLLILFVSAAAISIYAIITFPFKLTQQFSGLVLLPLLPVFEKIKIEKSEEYLRNFLMKGLRLHNIFIMPIIITFFILTPSFIKLWVGKKYLSFSQFIQLTLLFQLFWQSNAILGPFLISLGFTKELGVIAIITGLLNLFLSLIFLFLFKLGLYGVVLGTIFAGIIGVFILIFHIYPKIRIPKSFIFSEVYIKIHLFIILISLTLFYFAGNFINGYINNWLSFIISFIIFCSIFYVMSYFVFLDKDEKIFLNNILHGLKYKLCKVK